MNFFKTAFARLNGEPAQKALASIGVSVHDVNGELKDGLQIYREVAARWDSIGRSSKLAVAEGLAGKQHINRMQTYLDNFEKMDKILKTADNSYRSADEENAKHMKSLEARMSMLTNAGQELAFTLGEGGLKNVLITLTETTTNFVKGINLSIQQFGTWQGQTILAATGLLLLVTNIEKVIVAANTLKIALATVNPYAALATGAAIVGTAIITRMGEEKRNAEEIKKQQEGLLETYNTQGKELTKLLDKHKEFSKLKLNGNLSTEQEQEWVQIQNQIGKMLPNLTEKVDANGNAHIKVGTALQQEINYLDTLNQKYQENADVLAKQKFGENQDQLSSTEKQLEKLQSIIKNKGINADFSFFDALTFNNFSFNDSELKNAQLQVLALEKGISNLNDKNKGLVTNLVQGFAEVNKIKFDEGISSSIKSILDQIGAIKDEKQLITVTQSLKGFVLEYDKLQKNGKSQQDNLPAFHALFQKLNGTIPNATKAYKDWVDAAQTKTPDTSIENTAISLERVVEIAKEAAKETELFNKAELELYQNGELSQDTLTQLIEKYPDVTKVIGKSREEIEAWITKHKQMSVEAINNEKQKTVELVNQTKNRIKIMQQELEALKLVAEGHANLTTDKTLMTPEEARVRGVGVRNAMAESDALQGVLDALDKISGSYSKNSKLEEAQAKDAEKAVKDRAKAEKDAAKAAEDARKKQLDDLKTTEDHLQKIYDLNKQINDLAYNNEQSAYDMMKTNSEEAIKQLEKMIKTKKEALSLNDTEIKRNQEAAKTYEEKAKKEAAYEKTHTVTSDSVTAIPSGDFTGANSSLVNKYAKANDLLPQLVGAVMMQESSGKGKNIMQVSGMNNSSPEASMKKGTEMLNRLLKKTNGDVIMALAAYNMGEGILDFFKSHGGYSQENMQAFSNQQKKKLGVKVYGDPNYIDHVFGHLSGGSSPVTTTKSTVNTSGNASDFVKLKSDVVFGQTNINPYLLSLLENLAKDKGKFINLSDGGRTHQQQIDLKKQKPKLAATPGYSKHEYGLAADVMDVWLQNMSEAELAQYGLYKPALKSKGENWHIEPIQTKGVRDPNDIKKLSITLATGNDKATIDTPANLSNDLQKMSEDATTRANQIKGQNATDKKTIVELNQDIVKANIGMKEDDIKKEERKIRDSKFRQEGMDPTSPEFRKELEVQKAAEKEKQKIYHESAKEIDAVVEKSKKDTSLYTGNFIEDIKKTREELSFSYGESTKQINSLTFDGAKNQLQELTDKNDVLDRHMNLSKATMDLYKEGTVEYNKELENQVGILNQQIDGEKQYQSVLDGLLTIQGLSINQIEELNKLKDESIQKERSHQTEIKKTQDTIRNNIADNLGKVQDKYFAQLEKEHKKQTDNLEQQIKDNNDYYDTRIKQKEHELSLLDEQIQKEDRLKALQDNANELAKVKADARFEYINANGQVELTYDKAKVSELEKQRNDMLQQYQREDIKKARQDEIDALKNEKDQKATALQQQLDTLKTNYDKQVELEKDKWAKLIEGIKNGTEGIDEKLNGKDGEGGFYQKSLSDLTKWGVDVKYIVDKIKADVESLNNIKLNTPAFSGGGGFVGGSSSSGSSGSVKINPGSSKLPSGSGTYTPGGNGSGTWTPAKHHIGGVVGGKGGKLAEIANKFFNTQANEEIIMALKGEVFSPAQNLAQNFIPNMQKFIGSLGNMKENIQQAITNKHYHFNNLTIKADSPADFLTGIDFLIRSEQS